MAEENQAQAGPPSLWWSPDRGPIWYEHTRTKYGFTVPDNAVLLVPAAERDHALADRARDLRVVDAAKAVVERLAEIPESDKQAMYEADDSEPHIAELLDQLATEVREMGT